ncbi:MAG: transglycosylase SLT domain-containing protein [Wenzhouxiangellaceae bacterium]
MAVQAADRSQQRQLFRQAWSAAAQADWVTVARLEQQLGDYPLRPYLRAEQLRQNPAQLSAEAMAEYLQRHSDWSFVPLLRRQWLRHLGESDQFEALLRHAAESNDLEVRCQVARARIAGGADATYVPRLQQLWLSSESLPRSCDGPFRWLQQQQGIDELLAWRRVELALAAGNLNLARYLKRFLADDRKNWVNQWILMSQKPQATLRQSLRWPDTALARRIVVWGMDKLSRDEIDDAAAQWPAIQAHFGFSEAQQNQIRRQLALFKAVRFHDDAIARIDALPAAYRDDQLMTWRARNAIARESWAQAVSSIISLSADSASDSRWRYWLARGLDAQGEEAARPMLSELAGEAHFFGFLAADHIDQPYTICPANEQPTKEWVERVASMPLIERALELHATGLAYHARSTFRSALRGASRPAALAAAAVARDAGWQDQAVSTLAAIGARQHYDWRFPRAHQPTIERETRRHGLDPALVYGIIRAESALRHDAVSSAGAYGLMQLMPATAEQLAQRHGVRYQGRSGLLEADLNIRLGTAYLGELLNRFQASPLLAAGAYNAGPNAVQQWLDRRVVSQADVWLETIPYRETREYIPNVMAYTVIYEWLLDGQVTPVSQRLQPVLASNASASRRKTVNCSAQASLAGISQAAGSNP